MKQIPILFYALVFFFTACHNNPKNTEEKKQEVAPTQAFMENLSALCNTQLRGTIQVHPQPELIGTAVEFEFEECPEDEVRILVEMPGKERTIIILTLLDDEILLKHDVRTADMLPAPLTMYGGFSKETGTARKQFFPIHNFGREMWPGFEAYAWEISFNADGELEYKEINEEMILKHYIFEVPNPQENELSEGDDR
ncbi:MAG: hypothetical protein ACOCX0_07065 [Bacteroidota bacterium]